MRGTGGYPTPPDLAYQMRGAGVSPSTVIPGKGSAQEGPPLQITPPPFFSRISQHAASSDRDLHDVGDLGATNSAARHSLAGPLIIGPLLSSPLRRSRLAREQIFPVFRSN